MNPAYGFLSLLSWLKSSLVLLTHKACMWRRCNSLHRFFQWKSHMCAFPSASWPAWTWLAGCLEKWHDINKQCLPPRGLPHPRGLPYPGVWLSSSDATTIINQRTPARSATSEPLLRMDTHFIMRRVKLTISTNRCGQGPGNGTYMFPVSWREVSFQI